MVLKADQKRVRELLKETITLLCKNGLNYKTEFSIEALIGITLDQDDIFLVNIKETIRDGLELAKQDVESAEPDTSDSPVSERDSRFHSQVQSYPVSPSSRSRFSTGKRSFSSRRDGTDAHRDAAHKGRLSLGQPPAKRSHTQTSHQLSGSGDVVVIKEESLSDPELEQAEMEGQLNMEQDYTSLGFAKTEESGVVAGAGLEGVPPWLSGPMVSSEMSGLPGPSGGAQMSSVRIQEMPEHRRQAILQKILFSKGPVAPVRTVQRQFRKVNSSDVLTVMEWLSSPPGSENYIGHMCWTCKNVKVFYKCPPDTVSTKALFSYGLTLETYREWYEKLPYEPGDVKGQEYHQRILDECKEFGGQAQVPLERHMAAEAAEQEQLKLNFQLKLPDLAGGESG